MPQGQGLESQGQGLHFIKAQGLEKILLANSNQNACSEGNGSE